VVPILATMMSFDIGEIEAIVKELRTSGSRAAPGCKAEGIVAYHTHGRVALKMTLEKDDEGKGEAR
jgi:hypothetical protein